MDGNMLSKTQKCKIKKKERKKTWINEFFLAIK